MTDHGQSERSAITHESEAWPVVMTPWEAQAYRHYLEHRPENAEERAWLRARFMPPVPPLARSDEHTPGRGRSGV